jgi:hypothetical protein
MRRSIRLRSFGALVLIGGACGALLATSGVPALAATVNVTFVCTGAAQSWTVPAGVTSATFDVFGAAGGTGGGTVPGQGADGGQATATLPLTPGASVQVNVGCAGANAGPSAGGNGGFNGGGAGGAGSGASGGGGGGASDVRIGGTALGDRVLLAGGGGGGAANYIAPGSLANAGAGGAGGGSTGTDGTTGELVSGQGTGATQSAGGTGGGCGSACLGTAGSSGQGGDGGGTSGAFSGGGGGGGGFYGGGGGGGDVNFQGGGGGGGGGSGFGPAGTTFDNGAVSPAGSGNGEVVVSYATAASTTTTTVAAIPGATQPHTGEPWAGSRPYLLGVSMLGLALLALGTLQRRRRDAPLEAQAD